MKKRRTMLLLVCVACVSVAAYTFTRVYSNASDQDELAHVVLETLPDTPLRDVHSCIGVEFRYWWTDPTAGRQLPTGTCHEYVVPDGSIGVYTTSIKPDAE